MHPVVCVNTCIPIQRHSHTTNKNFNKSVSSKKELCLKNHANKYHTGETIKGSKTRRAEAFWVGSWAMYYAILRKYLQIQNSKFHIGITGGGTQDGAQWESIWICKALGLLPNSSKRQTKKGKERGRKGEERERKGKLALTQCKPWNCIKLEGVPVLSLLRGILKSHCFYQN